MSLIVGINFGNFALIAADKREMAILGNLQVPVHNNATKIIDSGIGYITGCGLVELLDSAKQLISKTQITHTDQIISIINKTTQNLKSKYTVVSDWVDTQIKRTGWLFTYLTEENEKRAVRLAIVHNAWDEKGIRLLLKGKAKVLVPIVGTSDESRRLSEMIMGKLKNTDAMPNLPDSLNFHIPILKEIFKYSSGVCDSVSENFHIAIHTKDGDMLYSNEIVYDTQKIVLNR